MDPSSPSGGKVDAQPLASPLPSASTPVGAVARDLYERIRDMGANMRRDAGPRAEGRAFFIASLNISRVLTKPNSW